jgi:hypothetical protein
MKNIKSMVMAVTTAVSATGTALAKDYTQSKTHLQEKINTQLETQSWTKDYTQSMHLQAKINTQVVQPWHKGYQPEVQPWSKLSGRQLKGAARMYNHGIKRV